MAARQRKAEKHRKKSKTRAREQRAFSLRRDHRAKSDAHPLFACCVNDTWAEDGKASIYVARTIAPGRLALASFLVDTWGMGLKDAWGRIDIPTSNWSELLDRANSQGIRMTRLDLATARHLIYGGIELAQEVGFRLPRRYERWTTLLGPLPAGEDPDWSLFFDEHGRIHVMCSLRDLEARLVGTSIQKFLLRKDIIVTLGDDDFTLMNDETEEIEIAMDQMVDSLVTVAERWCFANHQTPHPLLPVVASAIMDATAESMPEDIDADDTMESLSESRQDEITRRARRHLSTTLNLDNEDVEAAMAQFVAFTESAKSAPTFADLIATNEA